MVGNSDLINKMLVETSERDAIAYGMWQRYNLEPATKYEWGDPRKADGVPILARRVIGHGTINQRLHEAFDRLIVSNKVSYYASDIQVTFIDGIPQETKDFYRELYERASFKSFQLSMAKRCTDQGVSYFLCWIDERNEFQVAASKPQNTYVMRDPLTGQPIYGFRYDLEHCEVYDGMEVTRYKKDNGNWIAQGTELHGLGTITRPMVPIVELRNNPETIGNPEMSISLQDAWDTSMSDLSSEIAQMRLAYLLAKGLGADADTIKKQLETAGVIVIDSDNGDATFITKDLKVDGIRLLQETLRKAIFESSASYDPSAFVAGGTPPTAYQVSERLQPLEADVEITVSEWRQGFRQFDYLIQTYLMMFQGVPDYDLADIDRIFRRLAPRNTMTALVEAKAAGMPISNETMWELSGLQIDPEKELERLENEAANNNPEEPTPVVMPEAEPEDEENERRRDDDGGAES
jgi:SPP1 family phage portal protein